MYIVICGGGKVGASLAETFVKKSHDVTIIERSMEKCEKIAEEVEESLVIHGDACDVKYLDEAGAGRADVIAAVTGDDDDNLVICQLAKESYRIPRTVARVNNPKNEHIFHALGVDAAISATTIISKIIEEEATIGDIVTISALQKGNLALVQMKLPKTSPVVDEKISELEFPKDCVLVSIIRGNEVIIPRGSTVLAAEDEVIALTDIDKEQKFKDILLGKSDRKRR